VIEVSAVKMVISTINQTLVFVIKLIKVKYVINVKTHFKNNPIVRAEQKLLATNVKMKNFQKLSIHTTTSMGMILSIFKIRKHSNPIISK